MEKCLHCSKELKHVPGRKQKSFCDVNCRNKYFYAKRKEEVSLAKKGLLSLPPDYVEVKKVSILTEKGEIKPILPKPNRRPKINPPANSDECIEFHKQPENEAYDAPPLPKKNQDDPPKVQSVKPKNLDELKALCPFPEKTLERSDWVRTERQKYGI